MVNYVSSASAAAAAYAKMTPADKALTSILKSPDILEFLTSHSFSQLPPSGGMIMSALWALLNTKGVRELRRSDIEKAVQPFGIRAYAAGAFWTRLDPNNKGKVNAKDFTQNEYLNNSIASMLKSIRASVEETRQQNALKAV